MTTHCMLDLETMGSASNAAIAQIGAVAFSLEEEQLAIFDRNVDLASCIRNGLTVDGDTIMWWLRQDERARQGLQPRAYSDGANNPHIRDVLKDFASWYKEAKCETLWCHATFDAVILQNAYRACEMKPPFHYRDVRDLRTLRALYPSEYDEAFEAHKDKFTKHIAIEDAMLQARVAQAVLREHAEWAADRAAEESEAEAREREVVDLESKADELSTDLETTLKENRALIDKLERLGNGLRMLAQGERLHVSERADLEEILDGS